MSPSRYAEPAPAKAPPIPATNWRQPPPLLTRQPLGPAQTAHQPQGAGRSVEFYDVAARQGQLPASTHSKAGEALVSGAYTLTPHFNTGTGREILVYYLASTAAYRWDYLVYPGPGLRQFQQQSAWFLAKANDHWLKAPGPAVGPLQRVDSYPAAVYFNRLPPTTHSKAGEALFIAPYTLTPQFNTVAGQEILVYYLASTQLARPRPHARWEYAVGPGAPLAAFRQQVKSYAQQAAWLHIHGEPAAADLLAIEGLQTNTPALFLESARVQWAAALQDPVWWLSRAHAGLASYERYLFTPGRVPFRNKQPGKFTMVEERRLDHAVKRHGAQLEELNETLGRPADESGRIAWGPKSTWPDLQDRFNTAAAEIRRKGTFKEVRAGVLYHGKKVNARVFEYRAGSKTYYYHETLNGEFISAGLSN